MRAHCNAAASLPEFWFSVDTQMICYLNVDLAIDTIRDEPRIRAVTRRIGLS